MLVIPDGTKTICEGQYKDTGHENILVPKSVREIQESAFNNCQQLRRVVFVKGSTMTRIGNSAFGYCNNLKSIALPAGLEEIGKCAFVCSGLENVTVP